MIVFLEAVSWPVSESERAALEATTEAAGSKLRSLCRALLLRSADFQEAFKPPRKGSACGLQRTASLSSGRNKVTASVPPRSLATETSAPFLAFIGDERNVLYILIFMSYSRLSLSVTDTGIYFTRGKNRAGRFHDGGSHIASRSVFLPGSGMGFE